MLKKCSITKVVAKVMYWMILKKKNVLDSSDLNVLGSYALIYDSEWRSTVICFIYYLTYCQKRFTTGWYVFYLKSFTSLTCAGLLMQMLHNVCDTNNFVQFCQKPCRKEISVSRVYIHTLFAGSNREENSLRHVTIVAKLCGDNKPKIGSLWPHVTYCIALPNTDLNKRPLMTFADFIL